MSATPADAPLLRAAQGLPNAVTPVWLMRQAGRYMGEYRELRSKVSFLELCKTPALAAEVTVHAAKFLKVDAAILFADILLIVEPLGMRLEYSKGDGPVLHDPIRTGADLARLRDPEPGALDYVIQAVKLIVPELPASVPLIGFAGAPFTVASYMIEGSGSRNYEHTKTLMYGDSGAWHALMDRIVRATAVYLNKQIAAGCRCVQLFDSWVGCLSPNAYREFVLPHTRALIRSLTPGVPVINFGTGNPELLECYAEAGGEVIGIDFRIGLDAARKRLGSKPVQGNLDPCVLLADRSAVLSRARQVLDANAGKPGYIFNLGHGILQHTPVDNVRALVDFVHEHRAGVHS